MPEITIALDAMGGDYGPQVTVPAALKALSTHANLQLTLVGDQALIQSQLSDSLTHINKNHRQQLQERLKINHTDEQVTMDESPIHALRRKRKSSMRLSIELVKEGLADACVSAGNTGALMAIARLVLKTLPGIDRPAIIATFPTRDPHKLTWMLDLGANVEASADQLYQFAVMGSTLVKAEADLPNPRIGLLNVGVEAIKGNEQVKQADELLSQNKRLNYIGFVEGNAIFTDTVDLIVCDGFVGNITLKACEGEAKLIKNYIKQEFTRTFLSKLSALCARPILGRLARQLNPGRRNGASLLGLRGIVVKSHGGADIDAFTYAIEEAVTQATYNIPRLIGDEVVDLL